MALTAPYTWYISRTCPKCGEFEPLYAFEGQHICEHCIEEYLDRNGYLLENADNLCNECGWGKKIYRFGNEHLCLSCILDRLKVSVTFGTDFEIL